MFSESPVIVVRVDGGKASRVNIEEPRLCSLFESNDYRKHTKDIKSHRAGLDVQLLPLDERGDVESWWTPL
jgi:hypothetical protein